MSSDINERLGVVPRILQGSTLTVFSMCCALEAEGSRHGDILFAKVNELQEIDASRVSEKKEK